MIRLRPPHRGLAANLALVPGWAIAATAQVLPLVSGSSAPPLFDTEPLDTTQLYQSNVKDNAPEAEEVAK